MRRRLTVAILACGLVLAVSAGVSAQTTAFNAEIEGKIQKSEDGCPDGAWRCGEAFIEEFGPADYRFFLTSGAPTPDSCVAYTGITTFTLEDGSLIRLDEVGTACGPGNSFFSTPGHSWGNPDDVNGSWEVQDGTGQFGGMTGSGTDSSHSAGSRFRATYTGTLQG